MTWGRVLVVADINALYEELSKLCDEEPEVTLCGCVEPWDVLDAAERLSTGGSGLRYLLDFARCEDSMSLINSDEVLARVVKQLDAAVEEISAVRDIAAKYLPTDAGEAAGESEYMYNAKGEKVCASNSGDGDDPFRQSVMRKFTRQE